MISYWNRNVYDQSAHKHVHKPFFVHTQTMRQLLEPDRAEVPAGLVLRLSHKYYHIQCIP